MSYNQSLCKIFDYNELAFGTLHPPHVHLSVCLVRQPMLAVQAVQDGFVSGAERLLAW